MSDEDFLPDFRAETVWPGCFLGALWTILPIWGLFEGKVPAVPNYAASALVLLSTIAWFGFHWARRGKGYRITENAIERIEHGCTVWNLGWKNVVALPKGTKVEIQDLTGHSWGRITLDLSAKNSYGREGRILFARLLVNATRVEWRLPSLAERRRRYVVLGSTLLGLGLALSVPACLRTAYMFQEAELGIWHRGLNGVAALALFVGLLAVMLGVLELHHLRTDRSEKPSEPSIAEFLARPVPVPVEMVKGRFYCYRDADRIRASWRMQTRIVMIFLGVFLVLAPIAFSLGSRFREEPLHWMDLLGIEAMIAGITLLTWLLLAVPTRKVDHRFRRTGEFLEVDTGKEIKHYPWDSAREKMAKTRGSSWMSGYTTFGRGFRAYNLDRCWIELEEGEV